MSAITLKPKVFGQITFPMAAVALNHGEISCMNAAGYLTPGAVATGLVAMGVAVRSVDNSAGDAGDKDCPVATSWDRAGGLVAYPITNSGTDACDQTSVGRDVFIASATTVRKTSNSGACSRAGKCVGFRNGKVLVVFDMDADAADIETLEARVDDIEAACPAMQAVNATLASGTVTINTGIVIASNSEVIATMIGAITGSTNLAGLRELKASRVNGAAGVGAVVIEAVGADGAKDTDAAGAIRVLILTPL
jgi:hypothetical protein